MNGVRTKKVGHKKKHPQKKTESVISLQLEKQIIHIKEFYKIKSQADILHKKINQELWFDTHLCAMCLPSQHPPITAFK